MAQVSYGTITITDTNDIESIYVVYAKSPTNTDAPTAAANTWSTSIADAPGSGNYIWQRTVVKKSGVTTLIYGSPVCVTGPEGGIGPQGVGISSISVQYGISANTSTQPTNWYDVAPSYDADKPIYWTKTINNFSDGTSSSPIIRVDQMATDAMQTAASANSTASDAWDKAHNAEGTAQQASDDVSALSNTYNNFINTQAKYFLRNSTGSIVIGSREKENPAIAFDADNVQTYGFNALMAPAQIALRYNDKNLSTWSDSALTFYKPSSASQGNKAMELSSSGLVFYDGSASNGGNIQAQFGSSGAIQSGDYAINAITDKFSTYGTKIDLTHGEIYSPYFRLSQGSINGGPVAGIYMSGTFESTGALIGYQKISNSDTNAYWKIGYMTDTNQDKLAYQRADGVGFIELAPSSTFIIQKNKIHTGWFGNNGYLTYPQLNSKYYDFGINLPTSLSDKFLYIRYNTGTNLSAIYQNDSGWVYPFSVDAEGKVRAQNFYIGDSTTPIGGGSGTVAEKLMSGAGNATQPVYFRSDEGHIGEVAATTYQLNAAGAKGVDTSMPATATDNNVPTTKLMKTFVEGKGYITGYTESDPTVPSWAKASSKPSYSFSELTTHPTTLGDYGITDAKISNGVITLGSTSITPLTSYTETDPTVPSWAKASSKPTYSLSEISEADDLKKIEALIGTNGFLKKTAANTWTLDTNTYLTSYTETDPTVPSWAKASTKPTYSLSEITDADDIKKIEALTGTSGFLKKTASNTWSLDTTAYVPTSRTINGHALSSNISVTKSDVGLGNVTNYSQITKIGESGDGKLRVWTGDPDGTGYTDVEVHITAYDQSTVSKAEALNLSAKVGDTNKPVYFKADGKPYAISYTIDKSVPSDAIFTDTTYNFADSYNASTNKGATVATVTNAINALDGGTIGTPGTGKTVTAISQTNGNISVTFGNISITKSQISDFPSSMTPETHTHGNISNDGKITSTIVTVANNDTLLFADNSNSGKIERMVAFDGSTTTQALSKKGTWETFSKFSGSYDDLTNKPTIPTLPTNIVNTITTTAGAHTAITSKTGNVSFNVPTTAAHVGIKFNYSTSGNNRAVQQDSSGNLYVIQKDDNTNYYHTSGSWGSTNNLTYTATANGGAGALAFTLPTASTSTYGATKLSSTSSSSEQGLAATPKLVYDSINSAGNNYVAKSGDTMTGTLTTPEIITTKLTAKDVNVTHLLTAEGIQTKNWTTVNMATIDGSFYIVPTVTAATASVKYTTGGALEFTATGTSTFATNSLFINGDATNWTVNSLIMITGLIHIGNEDVSIGTLKGKLTAVNTANKTLTLGGTITSGVGTNTPSILGLLTAGSTYTCKDIKVSIYSYYNNSHENLLGIMMTTAGTKNRTYIDIYDGTHQTNGKTDKYDSNTTYTEPVVRIGNLRGLNTTITNGKTPEGWGIYTTNGYFQGDVVAQTGYIGGYTIDSKAIYSGSHNTWNASYTGIFIGTNDTNYFISGGANASWWIRDDGRFQFGGINGITYDGSTLTVNGTVTSAAMQTNILSALNAQINTLTSTTASIGSWTIAKNIISTGTFGNSGSMYLTTSKSGTITNLDSNSHNWVITAGNQFGVTTEGTMYATGAILKSVTLKDSYNRTRAAIDVNGLHIYDTNGYLKADFGNSINLYGGSSSEGDYPKVTLDASLGIYLYGTSTSYSRINSDGLTITQNGVDLGFFGTQLVNDIAIPRAIVGSQDGASYILLQQDGMYMYGADTSKGPIMAVTQGTNYIETGGLAENFEIEPKYLDEPLHKYADESAQSATYYGNTDFTSNPTKAVIKVGEYDSDVIKATYTIPLTYNSSTQVCSGTTSNCTVSYNVTYKTCTVTLEAGITTYLHNYSSSWLFEYNPLTDNTSVAKGATSATVNFLSTIKSGTSFSITDGAIMPTNLATFTAGTSATKTYTITQDLGESSSNITVTAVYNGAKRIQFTFSSALVDTYYFKFKDVQMYGVQIKGAAVYATSNLPDVSFTFGKREGDAGSYSTIIGRELIASRNDQTVVGRFNVSADGAFIVGNGSYNASTLTRSNACVIDWKGNMSLSGRLNIPNNSCKVLWTGGYYMSQGHIARFAAGERVSTQNHGIVLVWSAYENSAVKDYDWYYQFIPKWHVIAHAGQGVDCIMMNNVIASGVVCKKYVYIYDDRITGNSKNTAVGEGYANNTKVLRAVLGV